MNQKVLKNKSFSTFITDGQSYLAYNCSGFLTLKLFEFSITFWVFATPTEFVDQILFAHFDQFFETLKLT
jgi:hypothetical protein